MPIQILDPDVVSKIAAGEVVERPASVVKELLENSLDAGAARIAIEARGGGVNLIRVTDNGWGIAGDEAELAFHRYATSKIEGMADLDSISSLGFRGEALPSIAAVAEVELLTRTPDETAGTYLKLQQGKVVGKTKRGCPQGTVVTVRHLFRNFPARLKFLKSAATESSHISNLVSHYSLAFPEVRFALVIDGRMALQTPGGGDLRDVLVKLYGLETAEAMMAVSGGDEIPQVWGFVSPPSIARSSRGYLSFFVNRRWVNSPLLGRAVENAYQGLLMTGRHPIAVLNISLPYQDVDVNVHPTKNQVKFRYEHALFAAVEKAVRSALVKHMPVPLIRPATMPISPRQEQFPAKGEEAVEMPLFARQAPELRLPILRVLGQLASTYIIAEGPDGLYLVDQHAAHERILFEKVRAQRQSMEVEVQGLLEPLTIEVTPRQEEMLNAGKEVLASYGFAIEPFGQRTCLVRAVPALLKGGNINQVVTEILDSLAEEGDIVKREERIATSLACHGAVRAGQMLSEQEMRQLVRELELVDLPRTCPHGRPTMIRFTSSHLEKEFGRG